MSASVTLLRHATILVELGGQRVVIDPMLDAGGAPGGACLPVPDGGVDYSWRRMGALVVDELRYGATGSG